MARYIIRRTLSSIPVLLLISVMIYGILLMAPGGPIQRFTQNPKITQAQIQAFVKRWGLDQPWPIQYCRWLGACNPDVDGSVFGALPGPGAFLSDSGLPNILPGFLGGGDNGILHGDFGFSITDGRPVSAVIGDRVMPTLILAGTAWVLWVTIAIVSGVYAAVKRYGWIDQALTVFYYIGLSLPTFWLGLMLILIFAATLHLLPVSGMWDTRTVAPFGTDRWFTQLGQQPLYVLGDLLRHLILPVITLIVVSIAGDSRFVRSAMLDSLNQDYVRTARAKGVAERRVVMKHALRNALLPVVTNLGLELPFLFTGAIATETIFSWPGMGRAFIEATNHFDYPVLMGILVITAILVVAANLLADVIYAFVDPRISYG
jgi:peptide/nickel transport system permease protein